ncbi:MAG: ATP-dependent metallopeptidase FtsH/Yme1/Tma family protein, partial [Ignavibacteriales bacterium]|nr:ATP-dependent metallopeptidase FtsH/Yme1/Tma family protein [Ignavibacteriales bacterium]
MENKNRNGKQPERKNPPPRKQKMLKPSKNRPQKPMGDNEFNWSTGLRNIFTLTSIIVVVFLLITLFRSGEAGDIEVSFPEYLQQIEQKNIKEAVIKKSDFSNFVFIGTLNQPIEKRSSSGSSTAYTRIVVVLPYVDSAVIQQWNTAGFKYNIIREDSTWLNSLYSVLPWVFIFAVWLFVMRRMQGGGV